MEKQKAEILLVGLQARGFDASKIVPETNPDGSEVEGEFSVTVGCERCQALVINSVACHEHFCLSRCVIHEDVYDYDEDTLEGL